MAIIPKPYRKFKLGAPRADSRQKVLAQWRGIDLTPIEKARALHVRTAGDLMPGVLKELRIDRRRSEAEVLKGTLFVTVDSSVWLDEIVRYRRKEILDRLHHSFGRDLIARISFRVG
jgi:hypothetical protein